LVIFRNGWIVEIGMAAIKQRKPQGSKPTVFVIMPFKSQFDVFYDTIRSTCSSAKANCLRVDKEIHTRNVLTVIYERINTSDVIVADMTGQNPNVYFEAGYAAALKKPIVFLTQNESDIPFDLRQYNHVVYRGDPAKLRRELSIKLRWLLYKQSKADVRHPIDMYTIIDKSETPMFFVGMDGVVEYCNKPLAALLGDLSEGDIVGKTVDDLFTQYLVPHIPLGGEPGHLTYVLNHQKELLTKVRRKNWPHMDEFMYLHNKTLNERNIFKNFQMVCIHADRLSVYEKVLGWFVVYHAKGVDPATAKTLIVR
jgi:hypothetical protein